MGKNVYIPDHVRNYMTNEIARQLQMIKEEQALDIEHDMVLRTNFRKGRKGVEQELLEKAMRDVEPTNLFSQADTDWSVEAVEDEDELFSK